jgi:ATP-binding cassette subfamily B protein
MVPQHIELFSGSILENIIPGESSPDWRKLMRIAEQTGLLSLLNQLPGGFFTGVGEHGLALSGGERQRIGVARALYTQPDILILDECTASLDPVSESELMDAFSGLRDESLTIIIITHKLSLVREADHIILISDGKSPESGRHKELMELNGIYKHLWSVQHHG